MIMNNEFNITQTNKQFNAAEILSELGTMLKAGIPLLSAITLLSKNSSKPCLLSNIAYDLKNGIPLSVACSYHPAQFDKLTCQFILLGEKTGNLDTLVNHAAQLIKKKEKTKKDIFNALTYPAIILCVALLMITFMLIFVLPRFASIFESMGAELPLATQWLISLSSACKLIALPFVSIILVFRKQLYACLLKTTKRYPPFNSLWKQCYQLHFIRILAYCQRAGIDLHTTLTLAIESSVDSYFLKYITDIRNEITLGYSLSDALTQQQLFSQKIIELIKIAEASGELDTTLINITTELEEKQSDLFSHLSKLVEPVIMIILGVFMGGMVISLYLPVFKMGDIL